MSDERADRISHWLSVADEQDSRDKELAARYTAAATARVWILHRLDDDPDNASEGWARVREPADQADDHLDGDGEDTGEVDHSDADDDETGGSDRENDDDSSTQAPLRCRIPSQPVGIVDDLDLDGITIDADISHGAPAPRVSGILTGQVLPPASSADKHHAPSCSHCPGGSSPGPAPSYGSMRPRSPSTGCGWSTGCATTSSPGSPEGAMQLSELLGVGVPSPGGRRLPALRCNQTRFAIPAP
jgi:hypothetical protein